MAEKQHSAWISCDYKEGDRTKASCEWVRMCGRPAVPLAAGTRLLLSLGPASRRKDYRNEEPGATGEDNIVTKDMSLGTVKIETA
jgi:hypothetical protein